MPNQRVEIAISPCPNDVFIFAGLLMKKVHPSFDYHINFADIETLNNWSLQSTFDLIKASFAIYPTIAEIYQILICGSAIGFGVGPILVSSPRVEGEINSDMTVGVPGKYTTANFLLSIFYPQLQKKSFLPYNEIIPALIEGKIDLGVLIHEGRFVYEKYDLKLIDDLGRRWEKETGRPLPLGGLFVKRSLASDLKRQILKTLRQSLEYAEVNREETLPLLMSYAQELDRDTIFKHVDTYVNSYTKELNNEAIEALKIFFSYFGMRLEYSYHIFQE